MSEEESYTTLQSNVDQEYQNQDYHGSKTPFTIIIIVLISLLLLGVAILVFFLVANQPPSHQVILQNATTQSITVNGLSSVYVLNPNTSETVSVRSGQQLNIQAFYTVPNFNEQGFGTEVLLNLNSGSSAIDTYAVSVKSGFNLGANIMPVSNTNSNTSDPYSCQSPAWNFIPGVTGTGSNDCPSELQYSVSTPDGTILFQSCLSPCAQTAPSDMDYCCVQSGACQNSNCQESWGSEISYWNLMHAACPTCLITNCDAVNYYCQNNGNPISYRITFIDTS